MAENFGKHFACMYEGSMVGAGAVTFAVMGYVISHQRPELVGGGERLVVKLNPKLLALILGENENDVVKSIDYLCAPDPRSNRKEENGKRLVKLSEFEYWVVNGRYYRELGREERKREQNRQAQARYRAKKKAANWPHNSERQGVVPHEWQEQTGEINEQEPPIQ